jgi:non-specific serine/threonine protein kinase
MPLAIEFAAARASVRGVDEVALRLGNRFRLLTGGSRPALPRHQTLRATLNWSYELLVEADRQALCHLAVFTGDFTLEAAAAILSDTEVTSPSAGSNWNRYGGRQYLLASKVNR